MCDTPWENLMFDGVGEVGGGGGGGNAKFLL